MRSPFDLLRNAAHHAEHAAKMARAIAKTTVERVTGTARKHEPAPPLPRAEPRDYTRAELATYDGSDPTRPLLLAIRGKVYDVTRGRSFYGPGGPYAMFSGKDCTRALAKLSFEPGDFVASEEGLTPAEREKLEDWIDNFEGKYGAIGNVIE